MTNDELRLATWAEELQGQLRCVTMRVQNLSNTLDELPWYRFSLRGEIRRALDYNLGKQNALLNMEAWLREW